MKKKRLLTLMGSICLALVLVALLLPACAKEEVPVTPTPARPTPVAPTPVTPTPSPAGWEWPKVISIWTPPLGGGSHTLACAIAPILEKSVGIKVRVTPEDVEMMRFQHFLAGMFDINIQTSAEGEMQIVGAGTYAEAIQRGQPRILWLNSDNPWSFYVMKDSPIKTIYDLKGKRIGYPVGLTAMRETIDGLLEGLGLTEEEVTLVPISGYVSYVKSVVEGKTDVAITSTISSVTYEIEANPRGIRWLDIPSEDKAVWGALLERRPTILPGPVGVGVKSAIGTMGYLSPMVWWVRAESDQELAYNLAKWFDEDFDAYKDVDKLAPRMAVDVFRCLLDYNFLPVAEGTVRYLKEIGKWPAADDEWNDAAIELNRKYNEVWEAATAEAKAKGIAISYKNEEWLNLWGSHKEGLPRFVARI